MATTTREVYLNGVLVTTETVTVPDEVINERTLADRANAALADLATIANGSGNMSTAQLTTAVRALARALAALIRLQMRRLEAVD